MAVNVLCIPEIAYFQTNITQAQYHTLKHHRDSSQYVFSDHFSIMVNALRKHLKCSMCKTKIFEENQLEGHNQQYHPGSINNVQLPDGIILPAGWDRSEPSW